jgi:hypothetical protein
LIEHQRRDGNRFYAFHDHEDMQPACRLEAFPPCAYPFVPQEGMIDMGLVDQPVPDRSHPQKRLIVLDEFHP